MKANMIKWASKGLVIFSALSLLSVSLMGLFQPQSVMDLVQVQLNNNDAISSIRGVYGGTGFTITIFLFLSLKRDTKRTLGFLALFWAMYAVSRVWIIVSDGSLGDFGNRWMLIESILSILSFVFWNMYQDSDEV